MKTAYLGISAFYHDSGAALLVDGEIIAAAQQERFSRKKHDPSFPKDALSFVLNEAGLTIEDLTAIAFYDKPILKFERLLETCHAFAPYGLKNFLSAIPVWIKEKLFIIYTYQALTWRNFFAYLSAAILYMMSIKLEQKTEI